MEKKPKVKRFFLFFFPCEKSKKKKWSLLANDLSFLHVNARVEPESPSVFWDSARQKKSAEFVCTMLGRPFSLRILPDGVAVVLVPTLYAEERDYQIG